MAKDYQTEKELLARYQDGIADAKAKDAIDHAFNQFAASAPAVAETGDAGVAEAGNPTVAETSDMDAIRNEIWNKLPPARQKEATQHPITQQPVTRRLWYRITAAAAVAAIVFGLYLYTSPRHPDEDRDLAQVKNDITPGKQGATLTLANGKVIQLSDAKSGVVIGNKSITYDDGSSLNGGSSLSPSGRDAEGREGNNTGSNNPLSPQGGSLPEGERSMMLTASTAKGQTYQVELPDGTKVWLNADSKISFPSQFNGKERKILLSGEAYFEVVHNAKQPFRVESQTGDGKGQIVEDIGTEFNINAYADERSVKTTLVEGSARVTSLSPSGRDAEGREGSTVLKPNQQAILAGNKQIVVKEVDPAASIDWKEGKFIFSDDENILSIMRRVSRWYNVEVEYKGNMADVNFTGSISRFKNISALLQKLEQTKQVSFKIEGRKVTVIARE